jgi:oxygen-independent coproporphyrinogen-3 oxidase
LAQRSSITPVSVSSWREPRLALAYQAQLVRKYDRPGPRYTSYPTAAQFQAGYTPADYAAAAADSNADPCPAPLSLYVHIPFCATVCHYCACTKVITANRARAVEYLAFLEAEIDRQAPLFDPDREVLQLHLGGGSPTYLTTGQIATLLRRLQARFPFAPGERLEAALEIDPRTVGRADLGALRDLGFNRVSFGVQDIDPLVQRAVNRVQPLELTRATLEAARAAGYGSISVDLIYGLPLQSTESFSRTLDAVIAMAPDRISVFNYAHLPHLFKGQRRMRAEDLPAPEVKLEILGMTCARLTDAGYLYIGMDHFARPGDTLARALQDGSLTRNFQGYSACGHCDVVGLGMSSISQVGSDYAQNARDLGEYQRRISAGGLATARGVHLSAEDALRRDVIQQLTCHGRVDVARIESLHGIEFRTHFADELRRLADMECDGLVSVDAQHIVVLPLGRLLTRNVCMVFDAYLDRTGGGPGFSRAV